MDQKNVYIGMRYVPKYYGLFNSDLAYEPLSLVRASQTDDTIYISIIPVPANSTLTDDNYWVGYTATGDTHELEQALEQLTQTVNSQGSQITNAETRISAAETEIDNLDTMVENNENDINTLSEKVNGLKPGGSGYFTASMEDSGTEITITPTINMVPNADNYTSTLILKGLKAAYPQLFAEFPYINQISWVDKDNRNGGIITSTSQQIGDDDTLIVTMDNVKPVGGQFVFLLNDQPTGTTDPTHSRRLRLSQVPELAYPILPKMLFSEQISGEYATYVNSIPPYQSATTTNVTLYYQNVDTFLEVLFPHQNRQNLQLIIDGSGTPMLDDSIGRQHITIPKPSNTSKCAITFNVGNSHYMYPIPVGVYY